MSQEPALKKPRLYVDLTDLPIEAAKCYELDAHLSRIKRYSQQEEEKMVLLINRGQFFSCNPTINRMRRKLQWRDALRQRGYEPFELEKKIEELKERPWKLDESFETVEMYCKRKRSKKYTIPKGYEDIQESFKGKQLVKSDLMEFMPEGPALEKDKGYRFPWFRTPLMPHIPEFVKSNEKELIIFRNFAEMVLHEQSIGQLSLTSILSDSMTDEEYYRQPVSVTSAHPKIMDHFYFRDYHSVPLKKKLLKEFYLSYYGYDYFTSISAIHSIDYVPLNPWHLVQVNNLLHRMYWKGINVTSYLAHPDHTIIVLYHRLVIGCAFLDPISNYLDYICVQPDWQDSGIGSILLTLMLEKTDVINVHATEEQTPFFEKFGFQAKKKLKHFYSQNVDANFLQWSLR